MSQNFLFKTSKSETKVLLKSSNNFADTSPIQIIKKEEIIEKRMRKDMKMIIKTKK